MKDKAWYKLDNAANIYPPTTNSDRQANFGLTAVLTEAIDPVVLSHAVNEVLKRFPTYKTKLKRGVFWYYLEENTKPFVVHEMEENYLGHINEKKNNDYLFKVYYKDRTLCLVVYHALSDGNGGLDVFKALIYEYLKLSGKNVKTEGMVQKSMNAPHVPSEYDDTFNAVYNSNAGKVKKERNAFKTYGSHFAYDGFGEIVGKIKVEDLKRVAKEKGCTVTVLLSAASLYATYLGFIKNKKVKNKYVTALVPVDMRKWYPSETVRNFALFVRLSHDFEKEVTLDDCIAECKEQMKEYLTKENLDKIITFNVKQERNVALKLVPLFIKDVAMRIVYRHVGDNLHSYNLSNLGVVTLPDSVSKYVTDLKFSLAPSYSNNNHIAIVSYNGNCYITCTRNIVENYLEKEFFRILSGFGLDVELYSNYWEATLWKNVKFAV